MATASAEAASVAFAWARADADPDQTASVRRFLDGIYHGLGNRRCLALWCLGRVDRDGEFDCFFFFADVHFRPFRLVRLVRLFGE
jgi:hypothetical protein